jgi:hypothetical protein
MLVKNQPYFFFLNEREINEKLMEVSVVVEDNSSEWLSKFSDLITIYKFIRDSLFIQLLYYYFSGQ